MAKMDDLLAELENLGAIGEVKVEAPAPVAKPEAPAVPVVKRVREEDEEEVETEGIDASEEEILGAFAADYRLDKAAPVEEEVDEEEEEVVEEVAENEIDVEDVIERLRAVEREVKALIRTLSGG